jgi:hypothetical protein
MAKARAITLIGALTAILTVVGSARAQTAAIASVPIYTVKFVCGTQAPLLGLKPPAEPPVKPGNYATVINVEAIANDVQVTGSVSVANGNTVSQSGFGLSLYQTRDITCADISKVVGSSAPFITGFINISPARALSVTAVYTSQGCNFPPRWSADFSPTPVCAGPTSIEVVPQRAVTPSVPVS